MKPFSNSIKTLFLLVVLCGSFVVSTYSQTAGTLTFSTGTYAPNADYGTKHVLAVWLENTTSPSVFIKTKAKYGNEDDHLTSWVAKSGSNMVDAVSGATLTSYGTISGSWNGTNVSGTVVPDGTYKLFIEMGWGRDKIVNHSVQSYSFTKGAVAQHLTPAATTNYMNVVIDWNPVTTLVGAMENHENVNVYPNPSTGQVNLHFLTEMQNASLKVTDLAGKTIFSERGTRIPAGSKLIDLGAQKNGIYFIYLESGNLKYNYKVLINK